MVQRSASSLIGAAITLVLVLALLIGGGLTVRTLITRAFDDTTRVRDTLGLSRRSLVAQLDEETGVRGYAATHDRNFLEPFDTAKLRLPGLLAELETQLALDQLDDARLAAADAADANRAWVDAVALPIAEDRRGASPAVTEIAGKALVDRFRADIERINTSVTAKTVTVQTSVQRAIDRINVLIFITSLIVAAIGGSFLEWQRRAAIRIERERLRAEHEERAAQTLRAAYDAEKRIADSLQDAIELPNNRVLFAIGDVTGHGIEAAVTMNRARQALISSALLAGDPADVLARVNDEMYRQNAPLVTAVTGYADAGTYEFVYATAGHPPPLLIEPGRRPRLLDCGSLPLGALAGSTYELHRIQSVPGATLVLYTDGAVEHSRDVIAGELMLIDAAAGAAAENVDDTASYIHATIFAGRPVGDDVAILTIGFTADAATGVRISADDSQSAFTGRLGRTVATPLGAPRAARFHHRPERLAS
jgi:CHASE3 domain sensor protein